MTHEAAPQAINYRCPECRVKLASMVLSIGTAWACRACAGVCINVAVLRHHADERAVREMWMHARDAGHGSSRVCPSCEQPLRTFDVSRGDDAVELDACTRCQLLWFDGRELERVGMTIPVQSQDDHEPRAARAVMESTLLHEGGRVESAARFAKFLMMDIWYLR